MNIEDFRLMNAAGDCKRTEDVQKLAGAAITDITVGVMLSLEGRPGNSGETFWVRGDDAYALNSRGLPSPTTAYYRKELRHMRDIAHMGGKKLRANISAFSPEEYEAAARMAAPFVDEIEINLGCPNVWGDSGQKPIASFNLPLMGEIIRRVEMAISEETREHVAIAVKLSPYSNPAQLAETAELLADTNIDTVVTSNTFPNGMTYGKDDKPIIGMGFAGVSGRALLPIAVGQVAQFRKLLPDSIGIIGVGGISCADDVRQYIAAGAIGAQIGTYGFKYGPTIYSDIMLQL